MFSASLKLQSVIQTTIYFDLGKVGYSCIDLLVTLPCSKAHNKLSEAVSHKEEQSFSNLFLFKNLLKVFSKKKKILRLKYGRDEAKKSNRLVSKLPGYDRNVFSTQFLLSVISNILTNNLKCEFYQKQARI